MSARSWSAVQSPFRTTDGFMVIFPIPRLTSHSMDSARVGTAAGVHALGLGALYHGTVNLGGGTVRAAHGELPVPAPANTNRGPERVWTASC